MTAAIALSIVLVIAVAGASLAMQTQRPAQVGRPRVPRPTAAPRRPTRERRAPPTPPPPPQPTAKSEERKGPELLRAGVGAPAVVLGVVDERTTGSIVRSRLNLRVEPDAGDTFEVTVRHVFATLEARGKVRVGSKLAVRFDPDDHARVVIAAEKYPPPDEHPAPEEDAPGDAD